MICPLCETANADDATTCAECGKPLLEEFDLTGLDGDEAVLDLERTQVIDGDLDAAFALAALSEHTVAQVDDLEPTLLADPKQEVEVEKLELDGDYAAEPAESLWEDGVLELDLGREEDLTPRTPAPDKDAPCPYCGFPGDGAVCNHCGRRRQRYTTEAARGPANNLRQITMLCPSCLARVVIDERCPECQAPLPRAELP